VRPAPTTLIIRPQNPCSARYEKNVSGSQFVQRYAVAIDPDDAEAHLRHPREGFPPGTPWAEVPDDWACPDCGVRDKVDFEPAEEGA